jgi:hypothetical protein
LALDQKVQEYYKRQEIDQKKKERIREVTLAEEERRKALIEQKSKKIEDVGKLSFREKNSQLLIKFPRFW